MANVKTIYASAARTATFTSNVIVSVGKKGARFVLETTAVTGTNPTWDVKLQVIDRLTGAALDWPGALFIQVTGTETQVLVIYPGIAETTSISLSDHMPNLYQVVSTIGGTDTPTFTSSLSVEEYN